MARRRRFAREYPFISLQFLIDRHNELIHTDPWPSWRKIAIDSRQEQDVNNYDTLDNLTLDDRVLEQRILHYQAKAELIPHIRHTMRQEQLAEPFGSAPRFPAKYEVRFNYQGTKQNIHVFAAEYSAWHFIRAVINKRPYRWLDAHRIAVGEDTIIKSKHLELLLDYSPSVAERDWVIPIPYAYYAYAIATGESWSSHSAEKFSTHNAAAHVEHAPQKRSSRSERTRKRSTSSDTSKPARQRSQSTGQTGMFGIPELVAHFNKDAGRIRAGLRKSTIDKPDAGWVWPIAMQDEVRTALKKSLK